MLIENETAKALFTLHLGRTQTPLNPMHNGVCKRNHGSQTAWWARKWNEDNASIFDYPEEDIVVALFHDAFGELAPSNHGEVAATVLAPYISEDAQWVLRNHDEYIAYKWTGGLIDSRKKYGGLAVHPCAVIFSDLMDYKAFDPDLVVESSEFIPEINMVFKTKPIIDFAEWKSNGI